MNDDPIFDAAAFEQLKASVNGDMSFLVSLIADYLDDAAQHVATMRRAVAEGNVALLERTAHSLKSTSETVGAVALASVSRRIETLAHDNRLDEAAAHVPAAIDQFAAVQTVLRDQQMTLSNPR